MEGFKVRIHPLFLVFGIYELFVGNIFIFLTFVFTAGIHEMGHSLMAQNLGYELKKITLMPFGAVISGDLDGLKARDEIKIAMAGPLVNLLISLIFVSLWWLFPLTYPFTDKAVYVNFCLFVVNLLPVYPLDGGRILRAFLKLKFTKKVAEKVSRALGIILAIILLLIFFINLKRGVNLSLLIFASFLLISSMEKSSNEGFRRILFSSKKELSRGKEIKKIAVSGNITIQKLLKLLASENLYEIVVMNDNMEEVGLLTPAKLTEICMNFDIYTRLREII